MLHYTDALSRLMTDIAARVPDLAHVPMDRLLVFARRGRQDTDGPTATCHALSLPTSEPGYHYWSDRLTGEMTRRTPFFVSRPPEVWRGTTRVDYLISVGLPRFTGPPSLRKRERYFDLPGWVCRLDTIVHELFHIAPDGLGLRQMTGPDGSPDHRTHPPAFFDAVELLVREYLGTDPDPQVLAVLMHDAESLLAQHGGVIATTFRQYPSYPQRYLEILADQPSGPDVPIVSMETGRTPRVDTEADIVVRNFTPALESAARPAQAA
jgi:hypothetical protein